MNRRGLLGLLGGAALAGPHVTKEAVAKALGGGNAPTGWGALGAQQGFMAAQPSIADKLRWRAESQFYHLKQRERFERETAPNGYGMSVKIRSKRSWSDAFKASEHAKEQMEWEAIAARLREEGAAERLLRALGVDLGDLE